MSASPQAVLLSHPTRAAGPGRARLSVPLVALAFACAASVPSPGAGAATAMEEILGRPTEHAISLRIVPAAAVDALVELDDGSGSFVPWSEIRHFAAATPAEIRLEGLAPDHAYRYRLRSRTSATGELESGPVRTFHTARAAGETFRFAIEADPHLDNNTDPALYARALQNLLADAPDFLVDLGDSFLSDKFQPTRAHVLERHLLLRSYFAQVAHSAPLFLVLGNHEGEAANGLDGTAENLPAWATATRKAYFPNPEPDGFYSGDGSAQPIVGTRQSIYAWEWGDALFVVLDPYWFTPRVPGGVTDNWARTLGVEQFLWLRSVLTASQATFKLVFIHNLVGGLDGSMRGGAEAAPFYEWGGRDGDGSWLFDSKRPGWEAPIHQLLVASGVDIVFHGHDHFFGRQELDGIVYQEVPQPGWPGLALRDPADYGYRTGTFLASSGHLRVTVAAQRLTVDYVKAYRPADEGPTRRNGEVAYSYSLDATPSSCTPGATTLCVDGSAPGDRRFRIAVDYATAQGGGRSGAGTAVATTPLGFTRGGIFWFFDARNPELLVKLLDGCAANGKFWLYASAGTNVGYALRVTDTATGRGRTYSNLDLSPAAPVQDTAAFDCP